MARGPATITIQRMSAASRVDPDRGIYAQVTQPKMYFRLYLDVRDTIVNDNYDTLLS